MKSKSGFSNKTNTRRVNAGYNFECDNGGAEMINKSNWTNGNWSIYWYDEDKVKIEGPYQQSCYICGGDFENMLSALCAGFSEGKAMWEKMKETEVQK